MKQSSGTAGRKLTDRELRRKARFDSLTHKLQDKGYQPFELLISAARLNTQGLFMTFPLACGLVFLFVKTAPFNAESANFEMPLWGAAILAVLAFLALVVAHELIHGLVWGAFAEGHLRSIEFGMMWNMFMPYCTCSAPLTRGQYLLGLLAPTLVLGVGLGLLSVATGSLGMCVLAALLLLGGGGDCLIALRIAMYKSKRSEALYCDHPCEPGLVVFEK